MAGIFGNFMRGYEGARRQLTEDEERRWLAQEREYQGQRRGVLDKREDLAHAQAMADRERELKRDKLEYPLRFRSLEQGVESGDLGLQSARFAVGRQPVEAQQADELHGLNVQGAQQGMRMRASAEGRAAEMHRIQREMAELGLDEAQLQAQYQDFTRQMAPAARQFVMANDPKPLEDFWNQTLGAENPIRIERSEDGTYVSIPMRGGEPQPIGTRDDVLKMVDAFSRSPTAFVDTLHGLRFGTSARGSTPAAIQETEYVRSILPRREGESEQEHAIRALEYTRRAKGKPPEQEFRSIMQAILRDSETGDVQEAAELARQIMEMRLEDRTSDQQTAGLGAAMRGQSGAPQQPGPAGQQAGAPPVQGARQAPDGNWYVQRDGRWYRVD